MGGKISVVVLMAGAGSRFKQAGWAVPKPFIEFEGKMMVEHVLSSFDRLNADFVLVVQERFLTEQRAELERLTKDYPAKVVSVPKLTMGAAVTALAAHKAVDPEYDVIFADSDNIFDPSDIRDFVFDMRGHNAQAGLLTFASDDSRYSYAKIDEAGEFGETKEKVVISNHAICGVYYFKTAELFKDAAIDLIVCNDLAKGEFYMSSVYNHLKKTDGKIAVFDIKHFDCVGTPEQLEKYIESKKYTKEVTTVRFNNILLFAGETKTENMPTGFYSSVALYPLRGKPVIYRQMENLKKSYKICRFIVAVCEDNHKLIAYIKNILSEQFEIELVLVNAKESILGSLECCIQKADHDLPTRVILGDTLIPKSIDCEEDVLFTSKDITISQNWCLIDANGEFYDKVSSVDLKGKEALVGYYSFSDTAFLSHCCIEAKKCNKKELSSALALYQNKHKFKTKLIEDWFDLGHTSGLIKAKNFLFDSRCFNSVLADVDKGLFVKTSTNVQKLDDEAFWYRNLPDDLKIYTPRLVSFSKNEVLACLTQELYGYPSLQELWLSDQVNIEDWIFIIKKLFKLHKRFESYTTEIDPYSFKWLYRDKTEERLSDLENQNPYWRDVLDRSTECINDNEYAGIRTLKPALDSLIQKLCQNDCASVIHGDYCFSNILFDASNYIFKLIDPRGRLGATATIYGDPRYDIAKLRHSVVGLYDFIVQGLFTINETDSGFSYKIFLPESYHTLEDVFDKCAEDNGYKQQEIRLIEGLLFLSMIPLHKDSFDRQKMFYVRAVELLNNVVKSTQTI